MVDCPIAARDTCDTYDPNRLLDALRQTLGAESDESLSGVLDVEPLLIMKIRHGKLPVGSSLLIRMNEVTGMNVRELRRLMGDRRTQYRLNDVQGKRRLSEADDAGLPNFIQWG